MVGLSLVVVNGKSKRVCGIHFVGVSVIIISIVGLFSLVTGRKSKGQMFGCGCCLQVQKAQDSRCFRCLCL